MLDINLIRNDTEMVRENLKLNYLFSREKAT